MPLLNLAVNARDAMEGGGKLTIETGNALLDEAYARANEIKPGQYVRIAVTDPGAGMPDDVLAKRFNADAARGCRRRCAGTAACARQNAARESARGTC
jgi:hypothetical protein